MGIPRELVMADWNWLHETGELDPEMPLIQRVKLAAPRIGMSVDALDRALHRAGVRCPVEAGMSLRYNQPTSCQTCRSRRVIVAHAKADLSAVAKRLALNPDSLHLRAILERAQDQLASAEAEQDWHLSVEHDGVAA